MLGWEASSARSRAIPELKAQGEAIRRELEEQGRAVGLSWCSKCKDVVRLSHALRCPQGHGRVKDVCVVVPSQVAETEQFLRRRHG
jgi:hypothetical protein